MTAPREATPGEDAIRRILDSLTDLQFETNGAGEVIYHPRGVFGRGYRVPADQLPRMRQVARSLMLLGVVGVGLYVLIPRIIDYPDAIKPFGWLINFGGLAALWGIADWLASRAVIGIGGSSLRPGLSGCAGTARPLRCGFFLVFDRLRTAVRRDFSRRYSGRF